MALGAAAPSASRAEPAGPEQAKAGPSKERLPGHRNLFTGDCTFLFNDNFVKEPTAKYDPATLGKFIDVLADNGVDTYLYALTNQTDQRIGKWAE